MGESNLLAIFERGRKLNGNKFFERYRKSDNILNRFFYPGGVYIIRLDDFGDPQEILNWIYDNLKKEAVIKMYTDDSYYTLKFKTNESFMAFKLRWL